ncbi:protein phosphatase 1 regulatory subunit 32 isoform X1 [Pangasianodon hypophthalmus]|uniref:protein phosphatase 1 regulatory subunit 32 isoform X1 n=1 Tax=Pangasianodon hypophthalmus TaxID=310915 RepID=UPI002307AD12|nr:protein phosphatase 1 regulatory subunit 32 isoform X1 [Pangasianodon hypophthalmus]
MGGPLDTTKPSLKGKADRWMLNSSLNLHCTSYQHDYGNQGFSSCLGHHYGTGYSANLKPAVYYSPSLDLLDNPNLGVSLLDSFQSQTKRHYQPLTVPSGAEALPSTTDKTRESGYLQLHTHPRPKLVSCQTEYKCSYTPQRPTLSVYRKHQITRAKEKSGFTEGNNQHYNILLPQDTPMVYNSGEAQQTQSSVTRMDFHPTSFLQGNEVLPKLVTHAPRETAFTRDAQKMLTCPDSLLVCPRGHRQKSLIFAERTIGRKEDSGFILNTPILKTLSDTPSSDPLQFLSHYHTKFCNKAGFNMHKTGWNRGGIHKHRGSGYSGRDTDRFNLCGY